MAAKRILLLEGSSLTAHEWSAGHIKVEGEFNNDPVGLEAFVGYLNRHRSSLFYLLADVAEESFQLENLPYVRGRDRKALLQRRLSQYYYNTPLSTAIAIDRAKTGRRDEKLLFAALTRIETFTPWLVALRQAEAMLAGVYSVPLVLSDCSARVLGERGPVLFVTLTRGGVRQTFFDQGKLHFSRLSPLATNRLDEIGGAFAGDSAKIFQYLNAQRPFPRDTSMRTVVLAHASQVAGFRDFCEDNDELHFEFIDIADTARQLGLKDLPADSNADTLFIHCLATRTPKHQFAATNEIRHYQLGQIRSALIRTGWVVLAACLLFAAKTCLNIYELDEQIELTKAITASDTQRYNAILESLPTISLTTDNLRALIERFDFLQKRTPAMEPLLNHLGTALNRSPKIELTRLTWKIDNQTSSGLSASKISAQASSPATENGGRVVIELEAQLPPTLINDRRAQLELIESLAARLRDPRTEVTVLSRPFDIESDKPLRSISGNEPGDQPKFGMRIARAL